MELKAIHTMMRIKADPSMLWAVIKWQIGQHCPVFLSTKIEFHEIKWNFQNQTLFVVLVNVTIKFTIFLKSLPPLPLQSRVAYFVSLLSLAWALLRPHFHLYICTFCFFCVLLLFCELDCCQSLLGKELT